METRYRAEKTEIHYSHKDFLDPFPRFHLLKNDSSQSYDLLILNITDSDEGLYYCGTQTSSTKGDGKNYMSNGYGSVTRMIVSHKYPDSSGDHSGCNPWMVVFTPALTILSSLLAFILVYYFSQKTDKEPHVHQRIQTSQKQDEDMCLTRVVFRRKDGYTQQ
ncbi:uncharacterized protein [Paralichthys olivaceus]